MPQRRCPSSFPHPRVHLPVSLSATLARSCSPLILLSVTMDSEPNPTHPHCVCVRARARARARVCVCVCTRACVALCPCWKHCKLPTRHTLPLARHTRYSLTLSLSFYLLRDPPFLSSFFPRLCILPAASYPVSLVWALLRDGGRPLSSN